MNEDRLAGQIKTALEERRPPASRELSERLEAVAQRASRPRLFAPVALAVAVTAGVLLVIALPHRPSDESGAGVGRSSVGTGTAGDAQASMPGTATPGTPTTPATAGTPGTPTTPATAGPPGTPGTPGTPTTLRGSGAARGDVRDPLAGYQAVLDGTSRVAVAPAQAAKLRALAAELASQRAYLVERKREAEAELGAALAAANPDEKRVLAAYDRIAAQDAALGRAQLVARLGARAVLDAQQRSAIEGGAPQVADGRSRVTVKSPIASSVYIDGRHVGETPVTTNIAPGKHEVRLEAPGYDPSTSHFEIGDSSRVVLDLEPEQRGARPGSTSSASASASASVSGETGYLRLTTKPSTSIHVDGKAVGQTPISLRLTKGRHEIKMVGADQRIRKTMTLDVTPGQDSNLSFSFDD